MTDLSLPTHASKAKASATRPVLSSLANRILLLCVVAISAAVGLHATDPGASARAGSDLTNLLRFMAVLKAAMALVLLAAVVWRLAVPVAPVWLGAYLVVASAMIAGPGLIWGMDHVGVGALLLHGGLLVTAILLWRDPATAALLQRAVGSRRNKGARR